MNKKFVSRTEISSVLGVDRRTFSSYCSGKRPITNIGIRKKLLEITGIETFKSDISNVRDGILLTTWADLHIITRSNRKNKDNDQEHDISIQPNTVSNNGLYDADKSSPDIATDLRNWFNNQHVWKTQKEIAENIGISNSGMKKVFQGLKKPEGSVKQKLYEMTQLECFRKSEHDESVSVVGEKNISSEEDNGHVENTKICANRTNIPIYEIDISFNEKSEYTKKMKIPIHEINVCMVEIKIR